MRKIFAACAFLLLLAACKKEQQVQDIDGSYKGFYRRAYPAVDFLPVDVCLSLDRGSFTVIKISFTDSVTCAGNFNQSGSTIHFTSTCPPQGFAEQRVLDSTWKIQIFPDSITMSRSFPGTGLQEWYALKKQ
jgi:hypothetical protein